MKFAVAPLRIKKGLLGPFCTQPKSLGQPGLDGVRTVFGFPFLQRSVITAFGFYDFAGVLKKTTGRRQRF